MPEKTLNTPQEKEKTPNEVKKFAVASFLNDMGSDMIYPVWPVFVTSVLGADMTILGLIDGIGEAVVSLSSAVSGFLSDRLKKRKVFIWTGYLLGSVSRIGYALTTGWQQLLVFRSMDRSGKIRSAPRDALIADISHKKNRGGNFGILRAMDNLGAVSGILICMFFFERLGYRNLFLLAAIPSLFAVILILFFIREPAETQSHAFKGLVVRDLSGNMILFFILSSLFALGFFSYSFLLIFAREMGVDNTKLILLYLFFSLAASAFSLPFGKLSDRIGRKKVLGFSLILWILVCFLLSCDIHGFFGILPVFILYGIMKGALDPVQKTFVAELAPEALRASALGTFQMITGILALPASFIAGFLWDHYSRQSPMYFSIALTSIALFLLYFTKETGSEKVV